MSKIKNLIKFPNIQISTILFVLIPYSLIFSIFLTELILILLTFLYLKKNHTKLKLLFLKNSLLRVLLIFYFITLFSTFYNQSNFVIIIKNLAYVRFIFYAISISWILSETKYLKKYFLLSLISCYIILFIGAIYEFSLKRYCITFDENNIAIFRGDFIFCSKYFYVGNLIRADRISSFFGDEMVVGSFVSRILPLISYLIFDQFKNQRKGIYIFFLIFFISTITVILSGERVSLFYLVLFSGVILLYMDLKYKYIFLSVILVSSFLVINSSAVLKKRIFDQTYLQITKKDGYVKFFSTEHQSHAISALKIYGDNPVIGIGPKNFRYECRKEKYNISEFSCTNHPHNFYIQLLSETGTIGVVIPIFLFLLIVKFFFQMLYVKFLNQVESFEMSKIFIYTSFLITFFPLIPTGNIFNNWLSIVFYLPLGFFINLNKND